MPTAIDASTSMMRMVYVERNVAIEVEGMLMGSAVNAD